MLASASVREWWRRYESHMLGAIAPPNGYYWPFGSPLMRGASWVLSTTEDEDRVLRLVSPVPVVSKARLLCPERP